MKPLLAWMTLSLLGCDPALHLGAATHDTRSRHAALRTVPVPDNVTAARAVVASWSGSSASSLGVALNAAQKSLALATAVAPPDDPRLREADRWLAEAADRLASAKAPLEGEAAVKVEAMLRRSQAEAAAARSAEPTAASPEITLKTLRKHQSGELPPAPDTTLAR